MSALFLLGACRSASESGEQEKSDGRDGAFDTEDSWRAAWAERSLASADLQAPDDGAELLYERVGVYDDKTLVDESVIGTLSVEERTRAARPYRHLHEDSLYEEVTWSAFYENGTSEHGHRVWRRDNPKPASDPLTLPSEQPGPPKLGDGVQALLDEPWQDGEIHFVTVRLRGFPEWDVPLRARPTHVGEVAAAEIEAAREQRLAERQALYESKTKGLFEVVEANGGGVDFAPRASGYATLRVTREALAAIVARDDLDSVALDEAPSEPGWHLGEGLVDHRVDGGDFVDAGYDGSGPSSGAAIRVGFIEHGRFRNTACAFKDGANCVGPSRVAKMWNCAGSAPPYCSEVPIFSEFPTAFMDDDDHGTLVVAAAVADYTENQCEGQSCGDATTSHSTTWETRASSYAPDASVYYYGNCFGGTSIRRARHAEAFDLAAADGVDVMNFSQGTGAQRCQPDADIASETAAEDAFDDGMFIAACTGNWRLSEGATCDTTCGTWSVGSLAKTFAVAGFRAQDADCQADFADCRRSYCVTRSSTTGLCLDEMMSACRGGGDVQIGAMVHTGAATMTDALMSTNVLSITRYGTSDSGTVDVSSRASGCSTATPQLAGLAAAVKDYYLSFGLTFVDAPGRLHTLLLNFGDRADGVVEGPGAAIGTRVTGASRTWGMGRVRARFWPSTDLAPAFSTTHVKSYTPSSTAETFRPFLFSTPLPSGVELVKCSLLQLEDFSDEESDTVTISDIDVQLRIRSPQSGTCTPLGDGAQQTVHLTRTDASADWKKMVAVTSAQTTLAGRCVYVTLTPNTIEADGESAVLTCAYMGATEAEGTTP